MNDDGTIISCPLCGTSLGDTEEDRSVCPRCSFSFLEEEEMLVFDFRDMDLRIKSDLDFSEAIEKIDRKVLDRTKNNLGDLLDVPFVVKSVGFEKLGSGEGKHFFSDLEGPLLAAFTDLTGKFTGTLVVVIDRPSLIKIEESISGSSYVPSNTVTDLGRSTVMEAALIVARDVCQHFGSEYQMDLELKSPRLIVDDVPTIFNYIYARFGGTGEDIDLYHIDLQTDNNIGIHLTFFKGSEELDLF